MALYATFLALVGVPLLALNIDVARVYVAKARLRSATQAACQAYGGMLDFGHFRDSNGWRFKPGALSMAHRVFNGSAPTGGQITIGTAQKNVGATDQYILIECRGESTIYPLMWVGVSAYKQTQYAQVKVKFSTTENWIIQFLK
jgi:hypothetical protein